MDQRVQVGPDAPDQILSPLGLELLFDFAEHKFNWVVLALVWYIKNTFNLQLIHLLLGLLAGVDPEIVH